MSTRPHATHPIAVVIPAYNAEATISTTIDSVLAQSHQDFELVVVDDGSSDSTPRIVESYPDERLRLIEQSNAGTAGARNTGIAATSTRLVSFVDNDDIWMPDYLARMIEALERDQDAGFAFTDAWVLDDESKRIRRRTEFEIRPAPTPDATRHDVFLALLQENFVMSSVTIRRTALDATGGFDTTVRGTDDYDLWLRIMAAGFGAVGIAGGPVLIQRHRPDSQSRDVGMMLDNLIAVLERLQTDARMGGELQAALAEHLADVRAERRLAVPERSSDRVRAAARRRLGALRRALLRRDDWFESPPEDVSRAFGDVSRL